MQNRLSMIIKNASKSYRHDEHSGENGTATASIVGALRLLAAELGERNHLKNVLSQS
jgi:hypothetical protein